MKRAGTPAQTSFAGIDLFTTEPAAITDPVPIVTPCKITHDVPIQTSSSSIISSLVIACKLIFMPILYSCPVLLNVVLLSIKQLFPIIIFSFQTNSQA